MSKRLVASSDSFSYNQMYDMYPKLALLLDKIEELYSDKEPYIIARNCTVLINADGFRVNNWYSGGHLGIIDLYYKVPSRTEVENFAILSHELGHFIMWKKYGQNYYDRYMCIRDKVLKNPIGIDGLKLFWDEYLAWKYGFQFLIDHLDEVFNWSQLIDICIKNLMTYWHFTYLSWLIKAFIKAYII